jgi:hypothetical protein
MKAAWALALAYWVATSLGHLEFSLWLVRGRAGATGDYSYGTYFPYALALLAAAFAAWWVDRARRQPAAIAPVALWWALWGGCVVLADRTLTYSIYEYAHYPQYALLAVLVGRALDPGRVHWRPARVLFWTTLLGMGDELLQYLWIAKGYGFYLDFNDFVVNLLAGAAGVMLYYGFGPAPAHARLGLQRPEWTALAVLAGTLVLGFASGLVALSPAAGVLVAPGGYDSGTWFLQRADSWYGSWQESRHTGAYLVLPPWAGALLLASGGALFGRYAPRAAAFKSGAGPAPASPSPGSARSRLRA